MHWCKYYQWHHRFSHRAFLLDNFCVSTGTIVVWPFENDYFLSNIYMFLFCYHFDSKVSIQSKRMCYNLQIQSTTKETLVPRPLSLLQCKSSITHHGGYLIANFCLLCYYHVLILFFDHKYDNLDCFLRRSRRMRTMICPHPTLERSEERRVVKMVTK